MMRRAIFLISLALPLLASACRAVGPEHHWPVVENTGEAPRSGQGGADGM